MQKNNGIKNKIDMGDPFLAQCDKKNIEKKAYYVFSVQELPMVKQYCTIYYLIKIIEKKIYSYFMDLFFILKCKKNMLKNLCCYKSNAIELRGRNSSC